MSLSTTAAAHAVHAAAIVVPVAAMLVVVGRDARGHAARRQIDDKRADQLRRALASDDWLERRPPPSPTAAARRTRRLPVAAVGLAVSAGVHLWVVPEHAREWAPFAAFFAVLALVQLGLAAVLVGRRGPRRDVVAATAAASVAVVVLWAFTRAVAVPVGPEAGDVESVGALDVVASVAEAVTAAACVAAIVGRRRPRGPSLT